MIFKKVRLLPFVVLISAWGVWAQTPTTRPIQSVPGKQTTTQTATAQPAMSEQKGDTKIVDFEADVMRPIKIGDSSVLNLLGNVVFYHNGAIITCDSAIRYNNKRMECFRNVVVNKGTTYVYGDRADYNGDVNIARIFAPIIKMVDGDATMYTYNFSFNTLESIGRFSGGATISQKDNLLESERGYYYTKTREVVCVEKVELKNPDYKIQSDSLSYNMNSEMAKFFVPTVIWNHKGEILSADNGLYDKATSNYHFTKNSYILTKEQELWADSLDFNSPTENAILHRNIQMRDEGHKVMAFGDFGQYWGQRQEAMLTQRPSLVSFDPEQDSLYMRADSMFLYTIPRSEAVVEQKVAADSEDEMLIEAPVKDSTALANKTGDATSSGIVDGATKAVLTETIAQPTQRQIEQSLDADGQQLLTRKQKRQLEKEKKQLEKTANQIGDASDILKATGGGKHAEAIEQAKQVGAAIAADSSVQGTLRQAANDPVGTIRYVSESMDSLATPEAQKIADAKQALAKDQAEGNKILADSTAAKGEDSMVRVVRGYFDVKIYRKDFQAVCDSLVGFSIDSTMHLYIDPVLWNENNQIKSEIIDVFTKNQKLDHALFTGDPIMSSQIDSVRYNQVKGKVIEALFRNNEIYRTNVNGNGQTLYYMTDDDNGVQSLMGFLVAECADITFMMADKQIEQIIYRGNPVYTIYPMDKIPMDQPQLLPGFVWEIDRKPTLEEIFDRQIRPSQRETYEALPLPLFPMTEQIKAHIEQMIRDGVWRDRNDKISLDVQSFIQGLGY